MDKKKKIEEIVKEPEDKTANKGQSNIVHEDPENVVGRELKDNQKKSIVRDEWYYFDIE